MTKEFVTGTLNVSAIAQLSVNINGINVSGYTPIGIVRQWVINAPNGGGNSSACLLNIYVLNDTTVGGQIRCALDNNTAVVVVHVVVLYKKN